MYYQIKVLKGRNATIQKKLQTVFGEKIESGTKLYFRKSECEITVRKYSSQSGILEFHCAEPQKLINVVTTLSKTLKGVSVLLASVNPVKWYADLSVQEYRDGKIKNTMAGRGSRNSEVREAVEAYLLHRQLSD